MKHILSPGKKRRLARDRRIVQRRREGLDRAELARRFQLGPATISRILRVHRRATGENLCRLPRKLRQRPAVPAFTPLQNRRLAWIFA